MPIWWEFLHLGPARIQSAAVLKGSICPIRIRANEAHQARLDRTYSGLNRIVLIRHGREPYLHRSSLTIDRDKDKGAGVLWILKC
jgi:hypothetical protein